MSEVTTSPPRTDEGAPPFLRLFGRYLRDQGLPVTSQREAVAKVVFASDDHLSVDDIESALRLMTATAEMEAGTRMQISIDMGLDLKEAREAFEREYLSRHLALSGYNMTELARRVGQERTHLYRKLRSLGVDFRSAGSGED